MTGYVNKRMDRARSQRLFLVEVRGNDRSEILTFKIRGTTGTLYDINIDKLYCEWKCTCPDFENRSLHCKHIYFVIHRVLHLQCDNTNFELQWSVAEEKFATFSNFGTKELPELPSKEFVVVQQRPYLGDECPVCMEPMIESEAVTYCKQMCGKSVHEICLNQWALHRRSTVLKCPMCRASY